MSNRPLVSIIVPTFRAGKYLAALCASIVEQTMPDFEVLIHSDGGDDHLLPEVVEYGRDPRFQISVWSGNRGVATATEYVLRRVRGFYWCYPGADDLLDREFLETRVDYATKNPGANVIFGPGRQIDENGKEIWYDPLHVVASRLAPFDRREIDRTRMLRILLQENVVNTPSVLCRTATTIPVLLTSHVAWRYAQDYYYWILLSAIAGGFHYDGRVLHSYRIHAQQLSRDPINESIRLAEIRLVPLVALANAALCSPLAAVEWTRWRGALFSLWTMREMLLRRRGALRAEWRDAANRAVGLQHAGLCSRLRRIAAILRAPVLRWREKRHRHRQVWVNGLRAIDDPIFRMRNGDRAS